MANPFAAAIGGLLGKTTQSHSLFQAAERDDQAAAAGFISKGADVNEIGPDGWSPVQTACWHDATHVLGEILKARPELDARDKKGRTAVHLAAFNGSERCLRRVLHAGAMPDSKDEHGLTALHKACVTGQLSCIRVLLDFHADPNIVTSDGLTAMHLAAWKGQREALRLLSTRNVALNEKAQDGSTPMHEAVRSGDESTVSLLLQLGGDPYVADKFGRTPLDIAFASGNQAVYAALSNSSRKPSPAHDSPSQAPAPADFWDFLQKTRPTPGELGTAMPAQPPSAQQPGGDGASAEPHPRKQFEAWLGGIIFPQRAEKPAAQGNSEAGHPYGPPRVGRVGGSAFAQHRAEKERAREGEAASKAAADARAAAGADCNVQLTLDPYGVPGRPSKPGAEAPEAYGNVEGAQQPANPLGGLMKAIGDKAQKDIGTVMSAFGGRGQPQAAPPGSQPPPGAKPTEGDEAFYDSDDDDDERVEAALAGRAAEKAAVAEDWGDRASELDDWGTTGAKALAKKKSAARVAGAEGRLISVEEARAALDQMDVATSRAQGWLRGRGAAQRLAAMQALEARWAGRKEERQEAGAPADVLKNIQWQRPAPEREDEVLSVYQHLQDSVQSATSAAGGVGPGAMSVSAIDFYDIWKATDGFAQTGLLLEDGYGKVFQADVLGAVHAIRVLNSSLYSGPAFNAYLEAVGPLRHTHVVRVKGAVQDRGIIVSDLPESGNLLYVLQTGKLPNGDQLQWNSAVDAGLAVASALQYLHSCTTAVPHGALSAASVLYDRNAVAKVGDVGLRALCSKPHPARDELLLADIHSLGEILMQLMTLNTEPIDREMRSRILSYVSSGQHIGASDALGWPERYAQAFEVVALMCLKADGGTNTGKLLREAVVPALLALRGDTLRTMLEQSGKLSEASAPPMPAPKASSTPRPPPPFLCPLTQEVMLDPVLAADGFVYERSAIEQWLAMGRKKSPMTNDTLAHPYLTAQPQLRAAIGNWLRNQDGAARIPARVR